MTAARRRDYTGLRRGIAPGDKVTVIAEAPCGCKRYSDGTKYECLTHRYTYSGCQA